MERNINQAGISFEIAFNLVVAHNRNILWTDYKSSLRDVQELFFSASTRQIHNFPTKYRVQMSHIKIMALLKKHQHWVN